MNDYKPETTAVATIEGLERKRVHAYLPWRYFDHYQVRDDGTIEICFDHTLIDAEGYDCAVLVQDASRLIITIKGWGGDETMIETHDLPPSHWWQRLACRFLGHDHGPRPRAPGFDGQYCERCHRFTNRDT